MLTFPLCPLMTGKVPPSTHSPRADAMLSTPLCKLLREAGADKRVRAVVLRVDSPGALRMAAHELCLASCAGTCTLDNLLAGGKHTAAGLACLHCTFVFVIWCRQCQPSFCEVQRGK